MAIKNGTAFGIYAAGTLIGHGVAHNVNINHNTRETTTKDSGGWAENAEGLRDWSMDGTIRIDLDATYGVKEVFTSINNRASVAFIFESTTSGEPQWAGTGYFSKLDIKADLESSMEYSVSIKGTGALVMTLNA